MQYQNWWNIKIFNINCKNDIGKTHLHAASQDNEEAVTELLKYEEIDINCKDKYGDTPLHVAAQSNKKAIPELLKHKKIEIHSPCCTD